MYLNIFWHSRGHQTNVLFNIISTSTNILEFMIYIDRTVGDQAGLTLFKLIMQELKDSISL